MFHDLQNLQPTPIKIVREKGDWLNSARSMAGVTSDEALLSSSKWFYYPDHRSWWTLVMEPERSLFWPFFYHRYGRPSWIWYLLCKIFDNSTFHAHFECIHQGFDRISRVRRLDIRYGIQWISSYHICFVLFTKSTLPHSGLACPIWALGWSEFCDSCHRKGCNCFRSKICPMVHSCESSSASPRKIIYSFIYLIPFVYILHFA